MTKIIVDSNVLFSAILNFNSRIGQILINDDGVFEFYSPKYLRTEIFEHQDKLKKSAKFKRIGYKACYYPKSFNSSRKAFKESI